jgi:hypothetical protein
MTSLSPPNTQQVTDAMVLKLSPLAKFCSHFYYAVTHRHGGLPHQVPRSRASLIAWGAGDALLWMAEEVAAVAAAPWVSVWTTTSCDCDFPTHVSINALRRVARRAGERQIS